MAPDEPPPLAIVARYIWSRAKTLRSPWDLAVRTARMGRLLWDLATGKYGEGAGDYYSFFARIVVHESPVWCVFCGAESPDFEERDAPDPALLCPRCGSIGRWRVFGKYLEDNRDWLAGRARVLCLSYTPHVHERLRAFTGRAPLTVDLSPAPRVDIVADAQRLPFRDESFDLILHAHVLEHVKDDLAALREMHRVLKPSGRVVCNVPFENRICGDTVAPERIGAALYHGQGEEHNRVYRCYSYRGFARRLRENTPFEVREISYPGLAYQRMRYRGKMFQEVLWELSKASAPTTAGTASRP